MSEEKIITRKIENHLFMTEIRKAFGEDGMKNVTFVVRGFSMQPFLWNGRDKVVLVPPRKPQKGDVVLAEVAKRRYALHRVIDEKDGIYTMQGDGNPTWMTEQFKEENIVGIADAFIRKGKYVSLKSRKWRWYSTLWMTLRPLRRIILGIYRRTYKNALK